MPNLHRKLSIEELFGVCLDFNLVYSYSLAYCWMQHRLQCQHLICNECLPQISKGADETVKCPECRRFTSRDDIELVHMTEQERWDELLGVAQAWDAFDVRGEEGTSEEENEEYFINDATETFVMLPSNK